MIEKLERAVWNSSFNGLDAKVLSEPGPVLWVRGSFVR
jgi:hypothetical protein